jgi:hypothetical protein
VVRRVFEYSRKGTYMMFGLDFSWIFSIIFQLSSQRRSGSSPGAHPTAGKEFFQKIFASQLYLPPQKRDRAFSGFVSNTSNTSQS